MVVFLKFFTFCSKKYEHTYCVLKNPYWLTTFIYANDAFNNRVLDYKSCILFPKISVFNPNRVDPDKSGVCCFLISISLDING